jgi:DNA-binding NarL/FixJ family response regulator
MDLFMPVMDSIEATKAIRVELSDVEIMALTSVHEDASIARAVRARAIGYLLKDTYADELQQAMRGVAEGRVQLAPEVAAKLMQETEVLKLLARGKANKQIAGDLFIEEKTVKTHVLGILRKFDVRSRTQAALHAVSTGLVNLDEQLAGEPW